MVVDHLSLWFFATWGRLFALAEGHRQESLPVHLRRFWAPFRVAWRPRAYFAPDGWAKLCPDVQARDATAPLVRRFEELDVQATLGARLHRDGIWVIHAAAALAVFAAVAGSLTLPRLFRAPRLRLDVHRVRRARLHRV